MTVIGVVAQETAHAIDSFMGETRLPTVIDDGTVLEAYGANPYELVLIDPRGTLPPLRREWSLPDDYGELRQEVVTLLGEPSPSTDVVVDGSVDVAEPDVVVIDVAPDTRPTDTQQSLDSAPVADTGPGDLADTGPADVADTGPADVADTGPADVADTSSAEVKDVPPDISIDTEVLGSTLADFALQDRNPSSPWFGQLVGPNDLLGNVYLLFFASAG